MMIQCKVLCFKRRDNGLRVVPDTSSLNRKFHIDNVDHIRQNILGITMHKGTMRNQNHDGLHLQIFRQLDYIYWAMVC